MAHDPLLIIARLCSPLAGDPPNLDALLEYLCAPFHASGVAGCKVDKKFPAPAQDAVPIPIRRDWTAGADGSRWYVPLCSSPILSMSESEGVEHFNKRVAVEHAGLLAPQSRVVVNTTNSWTKSYRLPLRVRVVPVVAWFAVGDRREMLKLLRRMKSIGKKPSIGYGVVREWTVERADADLSWFAPSDAGSVLMRVLPFGDWLPKNLVGFRRDFAAVVPPMWHPERYCEVVTPC